jgi:hypothetical protein
MNGATLTAMYLDEVKRRPGPTISELVANRADADMLDAFYHGRYLSRPLFLGAAEREQLTNDLLNLHSALASLPNRLFGGDLAAFARAVGMNDVQVSAILRSRSRGGPTRQGRADLYRDENGFRLLELNLGSALGGMDNGYMCDALLDNPVLAEFAQTHRLAYVDTMREKVNTIRTERGFPPGSSPVVCTTDWPTSYQTLAPYMVHFAERMRRNGMTTLTGHIGQLETRDGRVWLGDQPIDIVDRLFMIEDLLESPEAPALMDPVLNAAARGEVQIHTPMDTNLYDSKGALAMLSDESNRSKLEPHELESLDRILPWTRMLQPGPVTLEDGRRVDMLEYVLSHQHDLALKPTLQHGGQGVLLGWRADTAAEAWEEQVRAALGGPYVIQRRIKPVLEMFPNDKGEPEPWIVCWGVFTMACGYGGVYARGSSVESNIEVINVGSGAHNGSAMHASSDAE